MTTAEYTTTEVFQILDVEDRLRTVLPQQAAFVAGPLTGQLREAQTSAKWIRGSRKSARSVPFSMSSSDTMPPFSPGIGTKRSRNAAPGSHPILRMEAIG